MSFVKDTGQLNPNELKEWTIHVREMINHLAPDLSSRRDSNSFIDQWTAGYAYSFQVFFTSRSELTLDSLSNRQLSLIEQKAKTMLPHHVQLNRLSDTTYWPRSKRSFIVALAGFAGFLEATFVIIFLDLMGFSYRGLKKTKEKFLAVIPKYQQEKIENLTILMHTLNREMEKNGRKVLMFVGGSGSMPFVDTLGDMYATFKRTLVINFDLHSFDESKSLGMTDFLYEKCSFQEIIQRSPGGAYFINAGSVAEDNPYLLLMKKWEEIKYLLTDLDDFSVILIKTPDIEYSPIALKLLELESLTIMVAHEGKSNRYFMQLHNQLKQNNASIVGFVIDRVSKTDISPNFWDS